MSNHLREEAFDSMLTIRERRIRVRYRRGLGEDAAYQAERTRAEEALRAGAEHAGCLYRRLTAASIAAWDARGPNDQPAAITAAALDGLPIGGLQRIVREATQQGLPPPWKEPEDRLPHTSPAYAKPRLTPLGTALAPERAHALSGRALLGVPVPADAAGGGQSRDAIVAAVIFIVVLMILLLVVLPDLATLVLRQADHEG